MKSQNYSTSSDFILISSNELNSLSADAIAARSRFARHLKWQQLWNTILNCFSRRAEPRIEQKRDRAGAIYYHVYDPLGGTSHTFTTEREVRIWLEQRYSL